MGILDRVVPSTKEDVKGVNAKLDLILEKIMSLTDDVVAATQKVSDALDNIAADIQVLKDALANTPLPPDAQAALDSLVAKADALAAEN